ncbi:CBS domain-containing protein [Streptomyces sp. NPDC006450]|uniref:CBS domain-containing protein n=1 Tax=Streptomyces sp. NPDC006450 TaxID=3155458 RepID=UPI0033AA2BD4
MRHRELREPTTREVVTVAANTPFKVIVRTLVEHRVPAVPVIDPAGRPLGVVSEGDLLPKSGPGRLLPGAGGAAAVAVDATGGTVEVHGTVQCKSLVPVIERLCRTVDGVVSVAQHLGHAIDGSAQA